MTAALVRENEKVLAAGPTGCGKSHAVYSLFTARFPRVLAVDQNGEKLEQLPGAIQAYGLAELERVLAWCARRPRWTVAACLTSAECTTLARSLVPVVTSASTTSYAREVGGLVLECGEAPLLFPNGRTPEELRDVATRARHFRLSWHLATQKLSMVDPLLQESWDFLLLFQTFGRAELERIGAVTSREVADRVKVLPRYHFLLVDKKAARITHATLEGGRTPRALEVLTLDGEPVREAPRLSLTRARA